MVEKKSSGRAESSRFQLLLGIQEIRDLFNHWKEGRENDTLDADESALADRVAKALRHLLRDPFHPGLQSHEIDPLSKRYGRKVFQSYVDTESERAWRIFWVYGPRRGYITWIGLEPHPEDRKSRGYDRVVLSNLPPREPGTAGRREKG